MLITEKHPEYIVDKNLGGNIRKIQIIGIVLFIITLFSGIIALTMTRDPRHFFWMVPILFISCAVFASPGRLIQPKCAKCGFQTDIETFDVTADAFSSSFGFSTETVIYHGSLYTRLRTQEKRTSKEDTAALVTQDYYICHTCRTYAPTFNKNYKQTAKNFEALKHMRINKKRKQRIKCSKEMGD